MEWEPPASPAARRLSPQLRAAQGGARDPGSERADSSGLGLPGGRGHHRVVLQDQAARLHRLSGNRVQCAAIGAYA